MKYKQCRIRNGKQTDVCYLNAEIAKIGYYVTLADSDDPKKRWEIMTIGDTVLEEDEIKGGHKSKNWYKKNYLFKIGNKK